MTEIYLLFIVFFTFLAYMYYFDNPGGMIPTWLINWAAKVSHKSNFWDEHCYNPADW